MLIRGSGAAEIAFIMSFVTGGDNFYLQYLFLDFIGQYFYTVILIIYDVIKRYDVKDKNVCS